MKYKNESTTLFSAIKNGTKIKAGEVRRLIDMELRNESRLVVVLSVNRLDKSAYVVLVNNMVEIATPRDVLLSKELTGAPFELALLPDFLTSVWEQQLETSPIFGKINYKQLEKWIQKNELIEDYFKENFSSQDLAIRGSYIPEFGDHVWRFRSNEIDALNSLGHVPEILASNRRFFEIWREPNEALELTDILVENNFDFSLLDSFFTNDAIRFERF